MKIAIILGTRPEIIKLSPIIRECKKQGLDYFILHTNQHFSPNMDKAFFTELGLPEPKYNLNIQESLHGKMTGRMLAGIEQVLLTEKPSWVLVQGDTNTVLAGALAASKLGIRVGHVEAGLRSYDSSMPEEINRIITDHVSVALFAPTHTQADILKGEGIAAANIHVTGNTIADAVEENSRLAGKSSFATQYKMQQYILLTMHRPSNVDDKKKLSTLIKSLEDLSQELKLKIYYPLHPRTAAKLEEFIITPDSRYIAILPPVEYLEMLCLEQYAQLIVTDSGGVQEEACILQVPCVTLRENTERPETIEVGANILSTGESKNLLDCTKKMLAHSHNWQSPYSTGATSKIMNLLSI